MSVFVSLLGAVMLWYLLDKKVVKEQVFTLDVDHVAEGDVWPQVPGLYLRIPNGLAYQSVKPDRVDVLVEGTAEHLARLEDTLRGQFDVPEDFLGGEPFCTKDLVVDQAFSFPAREAMPGLRIVSPGTITLTLSRRMEFMLSLDASNLEFEDAKMAESVDVRFSPSSVRVYGPVRGIDLLQSRPDLFKLAQIDARNFENALRSGLSARARHRRFLEDNDALKNLEVVNDTITITFERREKFIERVLENVEVMHLIPAEARPEGLDPDSPLSIDPPAVTLRLKVPESYFAADRTEASLRRDLDVYVDLGDMPSSVHAARLEPRVHGLPAGASCVVEPALIDVVWNIPDVDTEGGAPESDSQ